VREGVALLQQPQPLLQSAPCLRTVQVQAGRQQVLPRLDCGGLYIDQVNLSGR
jgi:hypothetical protein